CASESYETGERARGDRVELLRVERSRRSRRRHQKEIRGDEDAARRSAQSTRRGKAVVMAKNFYIETWGCQMNDLDSQRLSGSLKLRGYTRVESETEADLILLNTCSIRDKSEQKV